MVRLPSRIRTEPSRAPGKLLHAAVIVGILLLGAPESQAKTVLVGGSGGDLNVPDAQNSLSVAG